MLFGYVFRNICQRLFEYLPSTCCLPSSKQVHCLIITSSFTTIIRPLTLKAHPSIAYVMTVWPQLWHPPLGFSPLMTSCGLVEDAGHRLCTSKSWVQQKALPLTCLVCAFQQSHRPSCVHRSAQADKKKQEAIHDPPALNPKGRPRSQRMTGVAEGHPQGGGAGIPVQNAGNSGQKCGVCFQEGHTHWTCPLVPCS